MSGVRVLVGTRKGAFILTADGKRSKWDVSGPHFAGWEIYHLKGSPADPNRLYASQSSGWFGQVIQRSCDGGKRPGTSACPYVRRSGHRRSPAKLLRSAQASRARRRGSTMTIPSGHWWEGVTYCLVRQPVRVWSEGDVVSTVVTA